MNGERDPVPPQRRGEALLTSLVRDVEALKRAQSFTPDEQGRFQIGDVDLVFQTDDVTGQITVLMQNTITNGPLKQLMVLP